MAAKQSEFIVAGSRSAGAVRADRLDEEASVLLVEDAPLEPPPAAMDPAFALALMGSASDGAHTTTKQAGLLGRSVLMPHGRLVGDSSAAERISDGIIDRLLAPATRRESVHADDSDRSRQSKARLNS